MDGDSTDVKVFRCTTTGCWSEADSECELARCPDCCASLCRPDEDRGQEGDGGSYPEAKLFLIFMIAFAVAYLLALVFRT